MRMTNDSYCIVFEGRRTRERYWRDSDGWLKLSNRDRVFRMTAEQVLNHLLPALAFSESLHLTVKVEHYDAPYWKLLAQRASDPSSVSNRPEDPT